MKSLLKITVLLVFVFCTESLQAQAATKPESATKMEAASEAKDVKKAETAGKIYDLPDNGITIVLRAPASPSYQLVKISKGILGKTEPEIVKGLKVSLPKNTSVRFIVDQVNTLLYDVRIIVDEDAQQSEATSKESAKFPIDEALESIKKAQGVVQCSCVQDKDKVGKVLDTLKVHVENIKELHIALSTLLYETEVPSFYNEPVNNFDQIKVKAKKKTRELLKLEVGTSQEIKAHASNVIRITRETCVNKVPEVLEHLPENLSDSSNPIAAVFVQVATKLEAIEKAKWLQREAQDRLLTDQIKYTCIFIPKEANAQLKAVPPRVVTVIRAVGLRGLKTTTGLFISELRDENYVMRGDKIAQGSIDRWSKALGFLVHLPFYTRDLRQFRYALALSGGLPTQVSVTDNSVSLGPGPATVGVSLLFAGPESDSLISLTGGFMVKSVKRLKGYSVGDTYPLDQVKSPDDLTEKVNRFGVFAAVTFSYDIFNLLHFNVTEKE